MSKSNMTRRQSAPEMPTIQRTTIENSIPVQSNILSKTLNHPIVSLIGLIPSLFGIGVLAYSVLRNPDVSSDLNADVSQPFTFMFTMKNNSSLFHMQDVKIYCDTEKVIMTNNHSLEGFSVVDTTHTTIGPEEVLNFRCAVAGAPGRNLFVAKPGDILDAHISIFVKYTMAGISRTSPRTEFTWYTDGIPPHWIKGKIAD
jgi:hypothetical protein